MRTRKVGVSSIGLGLMMIFSAVAHGALPARIVMPRDYDGFHKEEFRLVADQIEQTAGEALTAIEKQWGLQRPDDGLLHPLTIRIVDLPSSHVDRSLGAFVRHYGYGPGLRQEMIFDLEAYRRNPYDVVPLFTHELAHVVLKDAIDAGGSSTIPSWFNEGLAQGVTQEGHWRVQADFQKWGHSNGNQAICDLEGTVDSFAHGENNFGCYSFFYLSVCYLRAKGPPDLLEKLIAQMNQGTPLPEAIHRTVGLDWPAYKKEAEAYAIDVFNGTVPIP